MSAEPIEPAPRRFQLAAEEWRKKHPVPELSDDQKALLSSLLEKLR